MRSLFSLVVAAMAACALSGGSAMAGEASQGDSPQPPSTQPASTQPASTQPASSRPAAPVVVKLVLAPDASATVDGAAVSQSDLIGSLRDALRKQAPGGEGPAPRAVLAVEVSHPARCTWSQIELMLVAAVIADFGQIRLDGVSADVVRASQACAPPADAKGPAPRPPKPAGRWEAIGVSEAKDLAVIDRNAGLIADSMIVLTIRPDTPAAVVLAALHKLLPLGATVLFRAEAAPLKARIEIAPWAAQEAVLPAALVGHKPPTTQPASQPAEAPRASFFSVPGKPAHIVYLIDRSGSMVQSFDAVRTELLASISRLEPGQDFHVILFAKDRPQEAPGGKLVPATPENRKAVAAFLDSARAEGQTDVLPALFRAFMVLAQADRRRPGKVIHLLTDGNFPDNAAVLAEIRKLNDRREVHILTYLYGERIPDAEKVLTTIAQENGGRFRHVKPD